MAWQALFILCAIGVLSFVLSFVGAAAGMVLGHLRLPLFVAFLGSPVTGASTNLAVSGIGALAGTYCHVRGGRVSLTALVFVGIPSAIGAAVGMLLFVKLNRFWAHIGLGVLLVWLGIRMLRSSPSTAQAAPPVSKLRWLTEILVGLVLGALAASTGLMMNSLRLPVLVRLLQGDMPTAVGSNMAIGLLTAIVGVFSAWFAGSAFDVACLAVAGPPTLLGSYLGATVTGQLRKETLQRALGWMVAGTGFLMLLQGGWRATRQREMQPPPQTPAEVQALEDETDEWFDEPEWAH